MRVGAVLNRLAAGKRVARKVLRAQISADFAVAANFQIIRQVHAFADERNAGIQSRGSSLFGVISSP